MKNNISTDKEAVTLKSLIPKREVDEVLWKQVTAKAKGSEIDKNKAVEILFKQHYKLPEESTQLLKKLADAQETRSVRLNISRRLAEKESEKLPYHLYNDLLTILRDDPDVEIKKVADRLYEEKVEPIFKKLNSIYSSYTSLSKSIFENYQAMNTSTELLQKRMLDMTNRMGTINSSRWALTSGLAQAAEVAQRMNENFSKEISNLSTNYYPIPELQVIDKRLQIEKQTLASKLQDRLKACPNDSDTNESHWKEYQTICKDILKYCIEPPLLEPIEESQTESTGGTQRRDLIFHIPHEVDGFWKWISITHSALAVIIECKNYKKELPANQVVITSKYFGAKRLGNFGIIVTRNGLSDGAKEEQKRLWNEDNKMIICLCNNDLIKMLQLKEHKEDPSKIIDEAIRAFRQSLA